MAFSTAHRHIGERYGLLRVIGVERRKRSTMKQAETWACCHCDCGEYKWVILETLNNGSCRSCGCMHRVWGAAAIRTHGMSKSPEYAVWRSMIERCRNPNHRAYHNYGGRGIKVCPEWEQSFESFIASVGLRPSSDLEIERLDNNGHYEPGNVSWVTRSAQARNRRRRYKQPDGSLSATPQPSSP